ncbi:hypothetical protein E1A91_A04G137300v1 [Gossypium mustelinum]|uniref:Uncharacterized protein n=1 Tax=Gossypium mustelinum TaxID=34275 RepID=A0A5D2ZRT3_GOSMU|nr:hypothetical protein E1A91_A04G137300v1 [Gossypium mustelinum]
MNMLHLHCLIHLIWFGCSLILTCSSLYYSGNFDIYIHHYDMITSLVIFPLKDQEEHL